MTTPTTADTARAEAAAILRAVAGLIETRPGLTLGVYGRDTAELL